MKKIICLFLAFTLLFSLCACGQEESKSNEATENVVESEDISYQAGNYITFGSYEQDNDISNGAEEIEWLILDIQDGKALVISKYALDCKPYNDEWIDVTWEDCTLRKWLNDDFLNLAFSADEKSMIPTVTVTADKNPNQSTNPGNDTQDKIFLLSIEEVNQYFDSDEARQCELTDFAVANGACEIGGNCWCWWLRSPGYYIQDCAAYVDNGVVDEIGSIVDADDNAVRPAMWIELG